MARSTPGRQPRAVGPLGRATLYDQLNPVGFQYHFNVELTTPGSVDIFATDGAQIYWALRGADVDGGVAPTTLEIRGVAKTDSTLDRATGLPPTRVLLEDVDCIYIVSGSGEVRRVAKQGVSAPELIGRCDQDVDGATINPISAARRVARFANLEPLLCPTLSTTGFATGPGRAP